ncbi:MAG: UvrD-helicase domain-containing protein, partial [Firmicutes bacterium]|nr:UvrD-helicase domain-containing protein [Bacillota bacterium]
MKGDRVSLTPQQQAFVDFQEGCALLHAPVGTGKTRALAERTAQAIRRGVSPERILCVTFTNRAAEEMRQRVALHCQAEARWVEVRTFHGLCAWMLRREAKEIGLPTDFVIFDEEDSKEILREVAPEQGARSLYHYICSLKVEVDDEQLVVGPIPEVL